MSEGVATGELAALTATRDDVAETGDDTSEGSVVSDDSDGIPQL